MSVAASPIWCREEEEEGLEGDGERDRKQEQLKFANIKLQLHN